MKVPISWLKDYVDIDLSLEDCGQAADDGRAGG